MVLACLEALGGFGLRGSAVGVRLVGRNEEERGGFVTGGNGRGPVGLESRITSGLFPVRRSAQRQKV